MVNLSAFLDGFQANWYKSLKVCFVNVLSQISQIGAYPQSVIGKLINVFISEVTRIHIDINVPCERFKSLRFGLYDSQIKSVY